MHGGSVRLEENQPGASSPGLRVILTLPLTEPVATTPAPVPEPALGI
jgi:hypothetical protein